jgi:hypothetical protein
MAKLCQLLSSWPAGVVGVQPWLEERQIYRQLSNHYASHGWLKKIGGGAYVRAGEMVTWQGGMYAIQQGLGLQVHIGGLSALELMGRSHFIPMSTHTRLYIYAHNAHVPRHLPKWFLMLDKVKVNYVATQLFSSSVGLMDFDCGNFSVQISAPERAILEVLSLVSDSSSLDHACLLLQYQNPFRADVVQQLLQDCKSQVLKRLFLYLAHKFDLDCLKRLNLKNIDLGRGVRRIGGGEIFDSELNIYVPKINDDIENNVEVPDV